MNCNENKQIAFSDVGVLTRANVISFCLTHARAHQRVVAEAALDPAGRELGEEECVVCSYLPLGFTAACKTRAFEEVLEDTCHSVQSP